MLLPAFRDWLVVPYYYHLDQLPFDLDRIEHTIYNFFVDCGIRGDVVVWSYFCFWLVFGILINFVFVPKLFKTISNEELPRKSVLYPLILLFLFNYWTWERLWMGQINVLRGHLMFIPVWFILQKYWLETSFKSWMKAVIALLVLSFFSVHHVIMIGFVYLIYAFVSVVENRMHIQNSLKKIALFVGAFVPSVLLQIYRFQMTLQNSAFIQIQENYTTRTKIIEFFSLNADGANLFLRGIIGSASWNTPTFQETESIKQKISFWKYFYPYWNPILAILMAIVIIDLLIYSLYRTLSYKTNFNNWKLSITIISILSLVLSFGFSSQLFYFLNQWFYWLPFSYIMREPAKFYSLFCACFLLLTCLFLNNYIVKLKYLLWFIVASNLVLFGLFFAFVNKVEYPKMMTEINSICKPTEKILFLPDDSYVTVSYSNHIFVPKHWYFATNCMMKKPITSAISLNNEYIYLTKTGNSEKINELVNNSECNPQQWIKDFKDLGFSGLIMDTSHYPELAGLESCLHSYLPPKLVDNHLYYYDFS